MLNRREFLIGGAASSALVLWPSGCTRRFLESGTTVVNDIHSQLNATTVDRVIKPRSLDMLQEIVRRAVSEQQGISIAGGRHAMGGQQFGTHTLLLDMTGMNRVLRFDPKEGRIEVESGIEWPELVETLLRVQEGRPHPWGIIQKQTGADRLSIGGGLAANIHGRGLRFKPFVGDIESFKIVDAHGNLLNCNRRENSELFRLAVGGYGLFGVVSSVTLRLAPRRKVQRIVEVIQVEDLMPAVEKRIADGFVYGDFQYSTDAASDDFLKNGVFSCYRPVDENTPVPSGQKELSEENWKELYFLGHTNKKRAFEVYSSYYLATSGQVYWSDTHQMSVYIDNYHRRLDQKLGAVEKATEVITEVYVPRDRLPRFLEDVRKDLRENKVDVIYGTIRLIEKDDESFLAWAKESYACVIFNLHVVHTPDGIATSAEHFRRLIDHAIRYGGSYFPTYHRWARREQVETCYPQFAEFLRLKRKYDPEERFQSDWYRHYKKMFGDVL
jgi:FAD/FMN-containing dehydrogenase